MMSVLIVDDEESIRFVLTRALRNEGYILDTAVNGQDALRKLQQTPYNLILLDMQMEPMNGLELFQAVRQQDKDIIVIILTAHGSLNSAIEALHMGAFNYLLKPVSPDIIRSQVRAGLQLWRKQQRQQQLCHQIETLRQTFLQLEGEDKAADAKADTNGRFLHTEKLHIDRQRQTATLNGRSLNLTTTEYNLLLCLVQDTPEPVSPQALLHCALGYEAPLQEARELIKWHIHQLRRKVETNPAHPCYIKTVRYKGYLWSG